jgi:hypothetical protein
MKDFPRAPPLRMHANLAFVPVMGARQTLIETRAHQREVGKQYVVARDQLAAPRFCANFRSCGGY